jgi:hypothetical protein
MEKKAKNMNNEFYKYLGMRLHNENRVSDITWALIKTIPEFEQFFINYFIQKSTFLSVEKVFETHREYFLRLSKDFSNKSNKLNEEIESIEQNLNKDNYLKKEMDVIAKDIKNFKKRIEIIKKTQILGNADFLFTQNSGKQRNVLLVENKGKSFGGYHLIQYLLSDLEVENFGLIMISSDEIMNRKFRGTAPNWNIQIKIQGEIVTWQIRTWNNFLKHLKKNITTITQSIENRSLIDSYSTFLQSVLDNRYDKFYNKLISKWNSLFTDKNNYFILKEITNFKGDTYLDIKTDPIHCAWLFLNDNKFIVLLHIHWGRENKEQNDIFLKYLKNEENIKNGIIKIKKQCESEWGPSLRSHFAQRISIIYKLQKSLSSLNVDEINQVIDWGIKTMINFLALWQKTLTKIEIPGFSSKFRFQWTNLKIEDYLNEEGKKLIN